MMKYTTRLPLVIWATLLAVVFGIAGCSKQQAAPKAATSTTAFQSAAPEVKADWDKVIAAVPANDYVTAILMCHKLGAMTTLTPEQRSAANDTLSAMNSKLSDAAQKGDAEALKARETIRNEWR